MKTMENRKRRKKMELENKLVSILGKSVEDASDEELYTALVKLVKERADAVPPIEGNKKLYYISAEFLVGRQLGKNLINLDIYDSVKNILNTHGKSIHAVERCEKEPSLGNGGLGRLAACFLDSIATLDMCGDGIGLNYHYGLFRQEFRNLKQYEVPDQWLGGANMLKDTGVSFPVQLAGKTYMSHMYDMDVIGYKAGKNTLHLFDLDTIDESIVDEGISFNKKDIAKNLTLFLYPDDSDKDGQLLRIYQQYFMVSNAAQLIIRKKKNSSDCLLRKALQCAGQRTSLPVYAAIRTIRSSPKLLKNGLWNICRKLSHT